jgi:hypothetical protein
MVVDPRIVRRREVEAQPERRIVVLLVVHERVRALSENVGDVALDLARTVEIDHRRVVVSAHAGLVREPLDEVGSRHVARAQVPLADERAAIPRLCGEVVDQRLAGEVVDARLAHAADADPVVDAVARGNVARVERCARRRAHRRDAEEVVEAHALRREPVEHRRADLRIAGAAERPRPLVVADDEQDVRPSRVPAGHAASSSPSTFCAWRRRPASPAGRRWCTIDCARAKPRRASGPVDAAGSARQPART